MSNPFFEFRGFNVPMFSWRGAGEFRASMEALRDTGANSVILDFALIQYGINANAVSLQPKGTYATLNDLSAALSILKDLGLKAWVKPVILTALPPDPHLTDWHKIDPQDPSQWFDSYGTMLEVLAQVAETGGAEAFLLGNEMVSMTTKSSYRDYWLQLISKVDNVFSGDIGTNAKALDSPFAPSELQKITFLDALDFIGISAYPQLTSNSLGTMAEMESGWHSDIWQFDRVQELRDFLGKFQKPVFFTELSSPTVDGGNRVYYGVSATSGQSAVSSIPRDFAEQSDFFDASFNVLSREFGNYISGVFGYNWHGNVSDALIDIDAMDDSYNWHLGGKPVTETITQWYSGERFSNGIALAGSGKSDFLISGFYNDVIRGGRGSDVLNGGQGSDILYGDGLPPLNQSSVELVIRGSGALYQGIAPVVSIWANGIKVGTIDVLETETYRTPDGQPWHGLDTYKFNVPGGTAINDLRIVEENWAGTSSSSHRDFYVDSISVDGTLLAGPWVMILENGVAQPNARSVYADGYMRVDASSYNATLTSALSDDDSIDGGAGLDTAVYSGSKAGYTLTRTSSGMTAASAAEGTDSLIHIERLQFTDKTIAFDLDGNAGQAYRLYQAAFDRVPDQVGLGYWIDQLDRGMGLSQVATGFINSAEFKALYGNNPSNAEFVTLLYDNVLHRAPDTAGYTYWMNELSHGVSREQALTGFSESTENKVTLMAFDMDGNMGKDYRLYQAAFDRKPDVSGLDYWYHQMNSGMALQQVASGFINSAEFKTLYGNNPSNAELVTLLYDNVLHRAPDTSGFNYWMNELDHGTSREDALIGFSESLENQLSLVGIVQTGVEFA